jgi:hypothetical protein
MVAAKRSRRSQWPRRSWRLRRVPTDTRMAPELPPGQSGLAYSIGFVVATGSLHAAESPRAHAPLANGRWLYGRLAQCRARGAAFLWKAFS